MALLRWWVIFSTIVAAAVACGALGLFNTLWVDDLSKLSFVTLTVFSGLTVYIGKLTAKWHKSGDKDVMKSLPACWYGAEALMGMGMMGTLLGFILMFQANVAHIDFTNIDTAKQILAQLTKGTTTAVVTTFVGLLCSLLTKLQLVNLERDLPNEEE